MIALVIYSDIKLGERLEGLSKGLDAWAVLHEGVEITFGLALFLLPVLFAPLFTVFMRGLAVLGPLIALLEAEKLYAERKGADFYDLAEETVILTAIFLAILNFLWPSSPALMFSIVLYLPVTAYLLSTGVLLYKAGVFRKEYLAPGVMLVGIAHELPESFMIHPLGMKLLRGMDPSGLSPKIFIIFLALQVIGPLILAIGAYRE